MIEHEKNLRQIIDTGLPLDPEYDPYQNIESEDPRYATARVQMFVAACALSHSADRPRDNDRNLLNPLEIVCLARVTLDAVSVQRSSNGV